MHSGGEEEKKTPNKRFEVGTQKEGDPHSSKEFIHTLGTSFLFLVVTSTRSQMMMISVGNNNLLNSVLP